jgi:hypothetical protein
MLRSSDSARQHFSISALVVGSYPANYLAEAVYEKGSLASASTAGTLADLLRAEAAGRSVLTC